MLSRSFKFFQTFLFPNLLNTFLTNSSKFWFKLLLLLTIYGRFCLFTQSGFDKSLLYKLNYSQDRLSAKVDTLLYKEYNILNRFLRDSENWANAEFVKPSEKEQNKEYETVITESAERLTEYFTSFAVSVNNSAKAIEKHAEQFYYDGRKIAELQSLDRTLLNYDFKLQSFVSYDNTSSHLPVEIYNGSRTIQSDLAWSQGMNKIFNKTHEDNENIYWSYFGTPLGLLRLYPGTPLDMPTLYDVRLDHWYIQSSTPPKHMLIAIDASGSVYGLVLELMKNTASQLLDTLNDNDFVSIIGFHETPFQLKTCDAEQFDERPSNNFLRATDRNKLALKQLMQQKLEAENIANFENMFSYSYSLFKNLTEEDTIVPICSKVLMVITDGADGEAKDAYSKISSEVSQSVRIFTYVEGSSVYDDDSLSWIACRNKGFFHKVPTNEAVRMQAMEYLQVLSRPMALNYHKMLFFSAPEIQYWNRNLGHALAATFPVYRKTFRDQVDQHLPHFLGVVGLDIPLFEIGQRIPSAGFSHDSVVIMINAKSHIVYHTSFFMLGEIQITYTPSVDISELLHLRDIDSEVLKRDMLKSPVGKVTRISVIATIHIERYSYTFNCHLLYSRIDVKGSSFVIIVLMPKPKPKSVASNIINWRSPYRMCNKICQANLAQAVPVKLPNSRGYNFTCDPKNFFCGRIFVAPLPYCPNILKFTSKSNAEMLIGLQDLLLREKSEVDCLVHDDAKYHYGKSLLQEVKLALEEIIPSFKIYPELTQYEKDGFLITSSGVSVILNNTLDPKWWEQSRNPINSPLFKKHLAISRLAPDGYLISMFSVSYQYDLENPLSGIEPLPDCYGISGVASISPNPYPVVSKLITRGIDPQAISASLVPLGVLGKVLDPGFFDDLFVSEEHAPLCNSEESGMQCYLVDDGGFIIAATKINDTSLTGKMTKENKINNFYQVFAHAPPPTYAPKTPLHKILGNDI